MDVKIESGRYINIVATIDKEENKGEILYVTPATMATRIEGADVDEDVSMVIEDRNETVMWDENMLIRYPSCDTDEGSSPGLIQVDIPYQDGMCVARLLLKGSELARYEQPAEDEARAVVSELSFAPMTDMAETKRSLTGLDDIEAVQGVSYSIEAKTINCKHWHAIAVGLERPLIKVDRNQFPGANAVDIRVKRITGFGDEIIVESNLSFEN